MQYTIILESRASGGYIARCVEIPGALAEGDMPSEALARIREEIEAVREARNELLHRTIPAVGSEIIMIEVADAA
jgi:predicted RNase H-like HicB family nuclease